MVAKPGQQSVKEADCIILAKIHMVAKPVERIYLIPPGIILAKIHMVAKQAILMNYEN